MNAYWMCATCETLAPMHQATCGGCGSPRTADTARLSAAQVRELTRDAAITKRHRRRRS